MSYRTTEFLLPAPILVTEQQWAENDLPALSVSCITYNHGPFIRQAIEGFLCQKTSFQIEIHIHDDASTDGTAELVKEYAEKYPQLIRTICQVENQKSKGIHIQNTHIWPYCKGRYIALCEGDDCWTDPLKLQKQVMFLEENPDYSICFHSLEIENKGILVDDYVTHDIPEITEIKDLTVRNYIPTPAVVYRNRKMQLPDWFFKCYAGDYVLYMLNAQFGKIKKLPDKMAIYRIHESNGWANLPYIEKVRRNINDKYLMTGCFSREVNILLKQSLINTVMQFFEIPDNKKGKDENAFYLKMISVKAPEILMDTKFASINPKPVKVRIKIWKMRLVAWMKVLISKDTF